MATDIVKLSANERVDLGDFLFLADTQMQDNLRQLGEEVLADPAKQRVWIFDGFGMSNPAGKQLEVARGRALLAQREAGVVKFGVLATAGDVTKTVDLNSLSPATYGVFIRFEFVDGESASRVFWNPAGDGSELAQTVPTKRLANWSIRVSIGSPGAEWLQIGTADNSGVGLVLVDQRPFYFEGLPSDSYGSAWSSDGGGAATDRDSDRATYGVKDFQTFTAAMRQCIEDIRGRGLRRWWEKGIGGMNIGFDTNPTTNRLAIRDGEFYLQGSDTQPYLQADSGDEIRYNRTTNVWNLRIASFSELLVRTGSCSVAGALAVGDAAAPDARLQILTPSATVAAALNGYADSGSLQTSIQFRRSRGVIGAPTDVVDTTSLGYLSFNGYHTGAYRQGAGIEAAVVGTPSASSMPTQLAFATCDTGQVSPLERVRITRDGIFGVGVVNPYSGQLPVQIYGATGTTVGLGLFKNDASAVPNAASLGAVLFGGTYAPGSYGYGTGGGGAFIQGVATEAWGVSNRGAKLDFYVTANATTGAVKRLTLEESGNLSLALYQATLALKSSGSPGNYNVSLDVDGSHFSVYHNSQSRGIRFGLYNGTTTTWPLQIGPYTGTGGAVGINATPTSSAILTIGGGVLPAVTDSSGFGSSSYRWATGYFRLLRPLIVEILSGTEKFVADPTLAGVNNPLVLAQKANPGLVYSITGGTNSGTPQPQMALRDSGSNPQAYMEFVLDAYGAGTRYGAVGVDDLTGTVFLSSWRTSGFDVMLSSRRYALINAELGNVSIYGRPLVSTSLGVPYAAFDLSADRLQSILTLQGYGATEQGFLRLHGWGTSNGPTLSNEAMLFAKDVGGTTQLFAKSEAGVVTQLSPHDPVTREWVFDSVDLVKRTRTRVQMEKLARLVEQLTGEQLLEVTELND